MQNSEDISDDQAHHRTGRRKSKSYRTECKYCGGSGIDPSSVSAEESCSCCKGAGWQDLSVDPAVLGTCRICNGSGKERGKDIGPCHVCKGSGRSAYSYIGLYNKLKKDN
ncbi:hypothetical protein KAR91_59185 [Candidatus Pacearchaeota archaeon]|nr:hypothetical protein [Candidatus Pacearchaeota archaeon]